MKEGRKKGRVGGRDRRWNTGGGEGVEEEVGEVRSEGERVEDEERGKLGKGGNEEAGK